MKKILLVAWIIAGVATVAVGYTLTLTSQPAYAARDNC